MDESYLIGGFERREVVLADYDERWPDQFRVQQARIAGALGPNAIRVEHVGSTAVPRMSAKAIVDVQLSVVDVEDEDTYLPKLIDAGYHLRVREPGHRMVRTLERDVHVHICKVGSDWERRHLVFRDWLRIDQADRDAYEGCKRTLALQDWTDMNEYAAAKGPLIAVITQHAESWAQAGSWRLPDCTS